MIRQASFIVIVAFVATSTIYAKPAMITFDELEFQPINGLEHGGVRFSFSVDSLPSEDAYFASYGPGSLMYVSDPSMTGSSHGVLALTFDFPTRVLEFGVALNTANALSPGVNVELFDVFQQSTGIIALDTMTSQGSLSFSEGRFVYGGAPVARAVIDFADEPGNFALDNLVYEVPEPAGILLLLGAATGVAPIRRRVYSQHL